MADVPTSTVHCDTRCTHSQMHTRTITHASLILQAIPQAQMSRAAHWGAACQGAYVCVRERERERERERQRERERERERQRQRERERERERQRETERERQRETERERVCVCVCVCVCARALCCDSLAQMTLRWKRTMHTLSKHCQT